MGGTRADDSPVGTERHVYDQPGVYFPDTRQGWVLVPERSFPELMGFWMKVYDWIALDLLPHPTIVDLDPRIVSSNPCHFSRTK
jgi:hypothetical protein